MIPGHEPGQPPRVLRPFRSRRTGASFRSHDEWLVIGHQLRISIVVLMSLMVLGAAGFMVLGKERTLFEAMFITAHVLTTVGNDRRTLSPTEEYWELFLMLAGILAAFYAGGNLVAFLIGGEINRLFGRRQLQNRINQLSKHFIVCGYGRMGRVVCDDLAKAGARFVLIETDPARIAEADRAGHLHLLGDAMTEDMLRAARIDQARGLASCLPSDADNVFVTLTAREMNEKLTIIARAEHMETESKLRRAGADRVICPPVISANRILAMMLHPAVDDFMEIAVAGPDLEISKVSLAKLPGAVGKELRELNLHATTGVMVVAVIDSAGRRVFNPPPTQRLQSGDEMVVISPTGGVGKLTRQLGE